MKFRFTCGQSDLYSNTLKSLIIMANIAGLLEYAELNTEVTFSNLFGQVFSKKVKCSL